MRCALVGRAVPGPDLPETRHLRRDRSAYRDETPARVSGSAQAILMLATILKD